MNSTSLLGEISFGSVLIALVVLFVLLGVAAPEKGRKEGAFWGICCLLFVGTILFTVVYFPYKWIFKGDRKAVAEESAPPKTSPTGDNVPGNKPPPVDEPGSNPAAVVPVPRDNGNNAPRDDAQDAEEDQLARLDGLREQAETAGLSNTKNINVFAAIGHAYLWKAGEFKSSTTRDVALVRAHAVYIKAGASCEQLGNLDTAYGLYAQAGVVVTIATKSARLSSSPRQYFSKYAALAEQRQIGILNSPTLVTLAKDLKKIEAAYAEKAYLFFLNQTE